MVRHLLVFMIFGINLTPFTQSKCQQMTDFELWELGWRLIKSSKEGNYELTNLQFDSLRNETKIIDKKYLLPGLEAKYKLGKDEAITEVLSSLTEKTLRDVCVKQFLYGYEACRGYEIEKVENRDLQIELVKMYINDQYVRSNLLVELFDKYDLKKEEVIIDSFGVNTDERNRSRLDEIIEEYGFPTKGLVGKDAMDGVFYIIQHSDNVEWQKLQLPNIRRAVERGDMDPQDYGYLYDRVMLRTGRKQFYGTQFINVDTVNKVVDLAETEDLENLDKRRMELGMMPIRMYEEIILENR
jgi:hypothetical protein